MPLLALCALLAAPPASDLEARFALASVEGVRFELASGAEKKPDAIEPPDCTRGGPLCNINWESAPAEVTPLVAETSGARVLLYSKRGDPLLLVAPGRVIVAFAPRGALVRWSYFNYLLHAAASEAAGKT